jgi:polysaccharide export outer membrane protein
MRQLISCVLPLLLFACTPGNLAVREPVANYVYKLGTGDRLRIDTYGEQRLSGEFVVAADGKLAFPLLGDLEVRGMTLEEFKAVLVARMGSELLRNPQVSVQLLNLRPVYILGEVARPGEFTYIERLSVFALVAKAGGYTYRANPGFAYIRREDETEERAVRVTSATPVFPGDTIRIPERSF